MKASRLPALRALSRSLGGLAALSTAPIALAVLLLSPPSSGQMLAVPLSGQSRADLPARLSHASIRFLAEGPFEGSLVVQGDRSLVRDALAGARVLLLAVPDAGCIGAPA